MSDCFWTDFVGCVEDCGGETPPIDTGTAALDDPFYTGDSSGTMIFRLYDGGPG